MADYRLACSKEVAVLHTWNVEEGLEEHRGPGGMSIISAFLRSGAAAGSVCILKPSIVMRWSGSTAARPVRMSTQGILPLSWR